MIALFPKNVKLLPADLPHVFSQIFHMCDEDGRRIPYMCGNNTSFNQKFRVCDWNYNVDCPNSPDWSVSQLTP